MKNLSIFKNMNEEQINSFLKKINARKIKFKKDELIFSKLSENVLTGIIISGSVNIIKYDDNGNRIILEYLEYNSLFGKPFIYDDEISIISASESLILFVDYNSLIDNHIMCINLMDIMANRLFKVHERIVILSKKTIREKLLNYFYTLLLRERNKSFIIPITYTELSDYLSIDRSALMRELKRLKSENIISINGKEITIENIESIKINML